MASHRHRSASKVELKSDFNPWIEVIEVIEVEEVGKMVDFRCKMYGIEVEEVEF